MAKEKISKMKRKPTTKENIFTNDTLDNSLISKIYKELTQLHSRKTNNPIKKMGREPKQTLLQGGHTEGPETYERMLSITSHQRDANQMLFLHLFISSCAFCPLLMWYIMLIDLHVLNLLVPLE